MREPRRADPADLYELLEVSPRASQDVIQAAYRALARGAHPDVNASGDAERRIRLINAAYEVLGDPARRARYDLEWRRAQRIQRAPAAARSSVNAAAVSPARARVLSARSRALAAPPAERWSVVTAQIAAVLLAVVVLGGIALGVVYLGLDSTPDSRSVFDVPTSPSHFVELPGR